MAYEVPVTPYNPQPFNPLEQMARVQAIRNAQQQNALQQQALQGGALDIQKQKQQLKDQQAFAQAISEWQPQQDPQGQDLTKKFLSLGGSGAGALDLQQKMLARQDMISQIASRDAATGGNLLEQRLKNNDVVAGRFCALTQLPDQQLTPDAIMGAANELAQNRQIDPAHFAALQKYAQLGDPKAMRQQLQIFQKGYMGESAQMEAALKASQTGEAEQRIANMKKYGSATPSDADKFVANYLQTNNLPDTPENRLKGQKEYINETRIKPAEVRVEGYGKTRFYNVLDTKNGNRPVMVSADELGRASQEEPGRYLSGPTATKALSQTALIEDIRGNIKAVRDVLGNPKMPEFTADQRAKIGFALGSNDPKGAIDAVVRGGALGSLTNEQQDYLINMAQLTENAMAMRQVLGAGQGSEDLRAAIKATLPNPRTPTKGYAVKQLDAFENILNRLEKGIPKVPLGQGDNAGGGQEIHYKIVNGQLVKQ